jgi:beta-glucosidase
MSDKFLKFPTDFLWGASTSAHQVEGNNQNNWSLWEKKNADRLACKAKTYWKSWQMEKFPEMLSAKNYISGRATDHYNRYDEDFDLMKELGINTYRFSIEWSRIEPEKGIFNTKEIEHYKKMIKSLRKRGIEPFVTLWHFSLPIWFEDVGGWRNKDAVILFSDYVKKVVGEIGENVRFWVVLNEPIVYASYSYLTGNWPPQRHNVLLYVRVIRNLIDGQIRAYKIIKNLYPHANVGLANSVVFFEAYKNKLINRFIKKLADWWWNFRFLNKTQNYLDFIGCNHYSHNRINFGFNKNENLKVSDMNWELYPGSIYYAVKSLVRYNKPIYITENGLADKNDTIREWYIVGNLINLNRAIKEGINIRGYFYWSLLDNFEWDKGFWPRFGLIEVDYKNNLNRRTRKSASAYKDIITKNAVRADLK